MSKKSAPKFYVVWRGRQTGIFTTWDDCNAQVKGFAGAQFKAFESRAQAQDAFSRPYAAPSKSASPPSRQNPARLVNADAPSPILKSYAVDAACSGVPGPVEYRGVETLSGTEIFRRGPYPDGTNNIGEFLAIVEALRICQTKALTLPIYSDSVTALSWVRVKTCRTSHERSPANAPLFDQIAEAENWLRTNTYTNPVLKWETDTWGENPADYGRK